ncbi:MAG: caspase family protein [Phaeodactylibacter sp.]|nr:caspase family protein [Phaeodactylibacter sp.]
MANKTKAQEALPNLYAVVVGINKYPQLPVNNQLEGCINDVNIVQSLLKEDFMQAKFQNIHIHKAILDTDATKENIVKAIQGHLGKAKKGDFALFYFSGHGIREKTSIEAFQEEEVDSNIGGVICTDFRGKGKKDPDDTVLCDKEFRYLIRELAADKNGNPKANVVALFDCCHSGSNTRSVTTEELPAKSRQISRAALPERKWEGFIFHDNPGLQDMVKKNKLLDEILPQGQHIMMAACLEVELAWEAGTMQSNGAFTQALTEVVKQHKGDVSYHDLHTRILNRMRFNNQKGSSHDQRQTPQFYINTSQPNDRYKTFLSNQRASQTGDCTLEYNQAEKEWRISLGALHGVPPDAKKQGVTAIVFPHKDRKKRKEANILKVYPMHSVVEFPAGLDKSEGPFLGNVEGLAIPKMQIFLSGEKEGVKLAKEELGKLLESAKRQLFELTGDEGKANYVLQAKDGKYRYHLPFEPARPIIRATPYLGDNDKPDPAKVEDAFNNFNQISEWSFLKNLNHFSDKVPSNLKGKTTMYPMELRMYEYIGDGKERRVMPAGNQFIFELSEEKPHIWIRFELENYSPELLHTSLVYMPYNFGFLADEKACFLRAPQVLIQEKEKIYSRKFGKTQPEDNGNGKDYLRLKVDSYTKDYNLQAEQNFLKFLSSKTPFEIKALHMEPLPLPDEEVKKTRGFDLDEEEEEPKLPAFEWEVRTYELVISNPEYEPGK